MPRNPSLTRHLLTSFALALTLLTGCASRVILVPHGEPVRLAEPARARVFVKDAAGNTVRSQNKVVIPAGWYALPR